MRQGPGKHRRIAFLIQSFVLLLGLYNSTFAALAVTVEIIGIMSLDCILADLIIQYFLGMFHPHFIVKVDRAGRLLSPEKCFLQQMICRGDKECFYH